MLEPITELLILEHGRIEQISLRTDRAGVMMRYFTAGVRLQF